MNVKDVRRVSRPPTPRGFQTIAKFTAEPAPGFAVYDCNLVRSPAGDLLVYGPPSHNGSPLTSLAPATRTVLVALVAAHLQDDRHNAQRTA
jgi:hypothetical protein